VFGQDGAAKEEFEELIERAHAALAELRGFDLERLALGSRGDAIVAVHSLVDRAVSLRTATVERMDRSGLWQAENAKSPAAWLRCRARRLGKEASCSVRRARKLRHTPKVAWSYEQGRIGSARVDAVLRVRNPRTIEVFARDEGILVGFAESLRFDDLEKALEKWLQLADTDGPDPDAKEWAARRFDHSKTLNGTWVSDGFWDRITGNEIDAALSDEHDRLFKHDWAAAEKRLGRTPNVDELERSPGQRRADALANLVRRGAGGRGSGSQPVLNIMLGLDMLAGPVAELLDGTILPPGAVARVILDSHIRKVVFDGPDEVLSISRKTRFFSGLLREVILLRDRECREELCDTPARDCDVDHVVPWPEGKTSEENGELKCGFHNRKKGRRRGDRSRRGPAPPDDEDG
jgi:Domain of unknown function (DUF222)